MPGTPGTLSLLSPARDWTSITFDASTPNLLKISSSEINLFFIGSKIRTPFLCSCIKSLSDETIVTFAPFLSIFST